MYTNEHIWIYYHMYIYIYKDISNISTGFGLVGKWLAAPFSPNNQVQKYLTLLACENAQVEGKGRGSDTKDFLERSRHKNVTSLW